MLKKVLIIFVTIFSCIASGAKVPLGITVNDHRVTKTELSNKKFNKVYKLQLIQANLAEKAQLAVLTQPSIHFLSANNYQKLHVINAKPFKDKKGYFSLSPELVDIDNDGKYEIMKGGGGYGQTALLDSEGYPLWEYKPGITKPSKMISTDLNNDKEVEFYAINKSSLVRLDKNGQVVWEVLAPRYFILRSDFKDIEVFQNSKTQQSELLVVSNDTFYHYNYEGKLLHQFEAKLPVSNFQIINWNQQQFILAGYYDTKIALLNFDGAVHQYIDLGESVHYHEAQAINVTFSQEAAEYLVVLTHSSSSKGLSKLSIISPENTVIYQEVIKATKGLISLPQTKGNDEVLVITNNDRRLVAYSFNEGVNSK